MVVGLGVSVGAGDSVSAEGPPPEQAARISVISAIAVANPSVRIGLAYLGIIRQRCRGMNFNRTALWDLCSVTR